MSYDPSTNKIDNEAVLGLAGVENSLAYRVHEIERHFHNRSTWWGDATGGKMLNIGTAVAVITPWSIQAGTSNAYGTVVPLCDGTEVLALDADCAKWDLHSVLVTGNDSGNAETNFVLQFGTSSSTWDSTTIITEVALNFYSSTEKSAKIDIVAGRIASNSPVYCRVKCNVNSKIIKILIGIHCYVG